MTIADLRSGLAAAVALVPIGGGKTLRSEEMIVNTVVPPVGVVFRNDIAYDLDLGDDGSTYDFIIKVYAGKASERTGQVLLDVLAEPSGSGSLKASIEGNTALRALCDWVVVKAAGAVKVTTVDSSDYLTVDFFVEIAT